MPRSELSELDDTFMGIPLVLAAAAFTQFRAGDTRRGSLLAGATATYLVGVLGVTIGKNIPLNDALDAFRIDEGDADALSSRRRTYEQPWNRWHHVRTLANVASFTIAAATALVAGDSE